MNQTQEYLAMGFKLLPSGRLNHNLWYGRKFGLSSKKDTTWTRNKKKKGDQGEHSCCGSKRAYCHKTGCKNRREILGDDDYSDLKRITK